MGQTNQFKDAGIIKRNSLLLTAFISLKFILHLFLINPVYDLQRDEYLHLDQANHLAWGYISVPPLTSWISFLIKMLGNSVFWVKFFPALFGALTMLLVWKAVEALKGNLFALILASSALLLSAILRINILYQPNSFDIFFWTLVNYTLLKYILSNHIKWLYALALATATGFLSKYNILFLVLGLLPAVLLTPHRKVFLNKHFYLSAAIAFLIVLPNILWQYRNGFPTIHQLQELASTQLVHVNRIGFLIDQLLFFTGSFFIIIAAFIALLLYKPFKQYQCFLWNYIFTLSLFILFKAKSYYAIGLYPIFIAFGSVYLNFILSSGWKQKLKPVIILLVIGLSIPTFFVAYPIQSPKQIQNKLARYKKVGMLRWEDGKEHNMPQDFADMLGWSELAQKVDSAFGEINEKDATLILCDNYGQAGAINYYSVYKTIGAVSFNADYINWIKLDKAIKNIILIKESDDIEASLEKAKSLFESTTYIGKIENPYAREQGTAIYLLQHPKTNINTIIAAEIKRRKSH